MWGLGTPGKLAFHPLRTPPSCSWRQWPPESSATEHGQALDLEPRDLGSSSGSKVSELHDLEIILALASVSLPIGTTIIFVPTPQGCVGTR